MAATPHRGRQQWPAHHSGSACFRKTNKPPRQPARRVGQPEVRAAGLATGLVDFKIARIDDHWTALAFTKRKRQQQHKE